MPTMLFTLEVRGTDVVATSNREDPTSLQPAAVACVFEHAPCRMSGPWVIGVYSRAPRPAIAAPTRSAAADATKDE